MNPHPYVLRCMSDVRTAELRAAAREHALARQARSPRPRRSRQRLRARAGWLLVELGLRLVRPPVAADTGSGLATVAGRTVT